MQLRHMRMALLTVAMLTGLSITAQITIIDTLVGDSVTAATDIDCKDGHCLVIGPGAAAVLEEGVDTLRYINTPLDSTEPLGIRQGFVIGPDEYLMMTAIFFTPYTEYRMWHTDDGGATWDTMYVGGGYGVLDTIKAWHLVPVGDYTGFLYGSEYIVRYDLSTMQFDTIYSNLGLMDLTIRDGMLLGIAPNNVRTSWDTAQTWHSNYIDYGPELGTKIFAFDWNHYMIQGPGRVLTTFDAFSTPATEWEYPFYYVETYSGYVRFFGTTAYAVGYGYYDHKALAIRTTEGGVLWDTATLIHDVIPTDLAVWDDSLLVATTLDGHVITININGTEFFPPWGISEESPRHQLKIYPNPVSGNWLHLSTDAPTVFTAEIIDISGRRISQPVINGAVDVSTLVPGTYMIRTTSDIQTRSAVFVRVK